jgi:hypothetical protein
MRAQAAVLSLLLGAAAVGAGEATRTPHPVIEPAGPNTQCVADPATMRRTHMDLLKHQRDDTVRGGARNGKASLKACVECHASPKTQSVAAGPTSFCVSCHRYAAVKIDCFECHTPKPASAVRLAANQGAAK